MSRVVYVGAYTRPDYRGKATGISVYHTDMATGALTHSQTAVGGDNPSYLAMHPNKRFLYAVNETKDGGVSAYAVEPDTGHLTLLDTQRSEGDDPCHLCVDPSGHFVLVANYTSGSIAVFPIGADGALGAACEKVQHHGSGLNPTRQAGPHMHMVEFSPDRRYLLAADLGIDQVITYRFDPDARRLTAPEAVTHFEAGAGPRHFAFQREKPFLYLINELASTITTYRYDAEHGSLTALQSVSTLPPGYTGANTTAEIAIAPSGRFVYGSNRGHDSIAVFGVDDTTGELTPAGFTATGGSTPRCFAITPEGTILYAANQNSDSLVVFEVNERTGQLSPTGQIVETPTPVCVLIADV